MTTVIEPAHLRKVFGAYPSGVVALAGLVGDRPAGLAASSFTSVSLDPPLVSVCIAHTSTTWPKLSPLPRLGLSVLAADQEQAGRQLAGKDPDRFAGLSWRASDDGAVFLDGAGGWLDVSVWKNVPAGDHDLLLLEVHDLDADHDVHPLVFHNSRFHRLAR